MHLQLFDCYTQANKGQNTIENKAPSTNKNGLPVSRQSQQAFQNTDLYMKHVSAETAQALQNAKQTIQELQCMQDRLVTNNFNQLIKQRFAPDTQGMFSKNQASMVGSTSNRSIGTNLKKKINCVNGKPPKQIKDMKCRSQEHADQKQMSKTRNVEAEISSKAIKTSLKTKPKVINTIEQLISRKQERVVPYDHEQMGKLHTAMSNPAIIRRQANPRMEGTFREASDSIEKEN